MLHLSVSVFSISKVVRMSCEKIKIFQERSHLKTVSVYAITFVRNCVIDNNLLANLIKLWTNGARNCEGFWIEPGALFDEYH